MKGTEKKCADSLETVLKHLGMETVWEPVKNDPPDFVFTVDGQKWAVEATELHQYVSEPGRDKLRSRVGAEHAIEALCERIQQKADLGFNRQYFISAWGPLDPTTFGLVEARALEYIQNGETERRWLDVDPPDHPDPEARKFLEREAGGHARVFIQAYLRPVSISWMTGLGGDALGGDGEHLAADIEATLKHAVDRMLGAKVPKIANAKGEYERKVLVVWKGYCFAEPTALARELEGRELGDLDLILLVSPDMVSCVADPAQVLCERCPVVWSASDLAEPEE